ncbi:ethanolamine ammonia-lyase subunit EutC [Herpetosiphon geysericola]|uniref:Ethanolamine ammonia-lyase small subunit n=1 Tax=Herpetosiphon geysericola TaxID=70996 RepID=A0A0P6YAY0_9CHLR|nr:ethanolamine ammonia-lyase subunit EutC [Herpetosiphon geysericola]KPL90427.1 ethanolamine ammonia-lyase [Herpetosiphon geysericola]
MAEQPESAQLWQRLRQFTNARIGLGRVGDGLPTKAHLAFQQDHALARDAVHAHVDFAALASTVQAEFPHILRLKSAAVDRASYLKRPDLGRMLDADSRQQLATLQSAPATIALVVADGLSAVAIERHAAPLLRLIKQQLSELGWSLAPLSLVEQGRVAIGDEIGELLGAELVVILIGERPGLSVADSLGIYLTYAPQRGRTDAERNCISNIHPQGLSYAAASELLVYLLGQARQRRLTGVGLKDERQRLSQPTNSSLE